MMNTTLTAGAAPASRLPPPPPSQIDATFKWFQSHPPTASNFAARRARLQVLDASCEVVSPAQFGDYLDAVRRSGPGWQTMTGGGLRFLGAGHKQALESIRTTRVSSGMVIWHLYNMGYVFKTKDACIGVDIYMPWAPELADTLDLLLATHGHPDHSCEALINAMLARKKPVVTAFNPRSQMINTPTTRTFGNIGLKVDIGDHRKEQPAERDNMLMYQIEIPDGDQSYVVYHSGDGNNFNKMKPDKPVDFFAVHVNIDMPVAEAIAHVKPRHALISHVMELGHAYTNAVAPRWNYDYACQQVESLPPGQAIILTWGERYTLPGTVLKKAGGKPGR